MFLPWNDFFAFIVASLDELVETEMAQIRYGDVGLASILGIMVGVAAIVAVARLGFRPKRFVDSYCTYPSEGLCSWSIGAHAVRGS